jgi:threonine dehydratase
MSSYEMIAAAYERIAPHARRTPLLSSPFLDEIAGRRVWLKAECLQHTGSFKFRGGWAALSAMSDVERARGVITFSSGNHAQGVANAAAKHRVSCVIIMPSDAPAVKIENTRALGATVVLYDRGSEDRNAVERRENPDGARIFISPYDNDDVISGQGTVGVEIAEQAAENGISAAHVLVPSGGGGLAAGIALACEKLSPKLEVHTVEPERFDDIKRSLANGKIEKNAQTSGSVCDAILTLCPGEKTFPILQRLAGTGIMVTEEEALRAMVLAFERLRVVIEPGGAVSLAAALFHGDELEHDDVIVVATGGNVDCALFNKALAQYGSKS